MAGQVKKTGYNQEDLVNLLRRLRNDYISHSVTTIPLWVPATAPADLRLAAAALNILAYPDGVPTIKATADPNIDLPGAFGLTPVAAGQSNVVLIQMDSAGTITLKQGPLVVGAAGDTVKTVPVPLPDAGVSIIGYIVIVNKVFTWGTTAFGAGDLKDGSPFLLPSINLAGYGQVGLES